MLFSKKLSNCRDLLTHENRHFEIEVNQFMPKSDNFLLNKFSIPF